MKDLITVLVRQLSSYLPLLFAVVARPRQNIPTLVNSREEPLPDALIFCAITIAISFVLQAPLLREGHDFVVTAGVLMTYKIIEIVVFNAALMFIFKIIGGAGTFEKTFVSSLYIVSPTVLFMIIPYVVMLGIVSNFNPTISEEWRMTGQLSGSSMQTMFEINAGASIAFLLLALSQFALIVGWFLYCWPVYTRLHALTRFKAVLSYLLAFILFLAANRLNVAIMHGLFAENLPGII